MSASSLEAAVQRLNDRIAHDPEINPELFARLHAAQRAEGLLHDTRPIGSFLRPLVLPRSRYETIKRAAETIAVAMERLVEEALRDEALMVDLGLTEREAALARIDPGYPTLCVSSRLDAFLSDAGFQFLEYNAESPAGIVDQLLLEKIFFDLPHIREFLQQHSPWLPRPHQHLLRALVDTYRAWGGDKEQPCIGIIDWAGVSTESEFKVLKSYFESEGYPTLIADPHELDYTNHTLTARGSTIDILYKRVIIHELLAKFDDTHPMLRAYRDGSVCMANSFRVKVAHKKASFAILSDPRYEHFFTAEQLAVIRNHIPWTRHLRRGLTTYELIEHDMLDLVQRKRERLVIKPNDEYGGHGVVIGAETDPQEWWQIILGALKDSYVVQERVPVKKERMPMFTDHLEWPEMLIDFDPFLFLNKVEGGIVRLSESSLCNVSSGGGVTSLVVLEDD
ncbi:MAG: hypothetical protein H0T92_05020 [Pyrinomonadaceae bacterium]|nr:hypothetical protein [Pyrinomonadaceae bacterium]